MKITLRVSLFAYMVFSAFLALFDPKYILQMLKDNEAAEKARGDDGTT